MANNRLIVQSNNSASVIDGPYDIFGSNSGSENVTVYDNTKAYFQGDFQRGGDRIRLTGKADEFEARVVGSNVIIYSELNGITASVPIGAVGCDIVFENIDGEMIDSRKLIFKNGSVNIGDQIIGVSPKVLDEYRDSISISDKFDPLNFGSGVESIGFAIDVHGVGGVGSIVVWSETADASGSKNNINMTLINNNGIVEREIVLKQVGFVGNIDVDVSDEGYISISEINTIGEVIFNKFNIDGVNIVNNLKIGSFSDIGYNQTIINSDFDADGNALVVWKTKVDGYDQIVGALISESGELKSNLQITTSGSQFNPMRSRVESLDGGGFVSIWTESHGPPHVFGQIIGSNGVKSGPKFQITPSGTDGNYYASSVIDLEGAGFVVGYHTGIYYDNYSINRLSIRIYDDSGNPVTQEIVVSPDKSPFALQMVALSGGNFAVSWSEIETGYETSVPVYTRIYDSTGNPISEKFLVAQSAVISRESDSYIGSDGNNLIFSWSEKVSGSDYDVKFQELFLTQGSNLSNISVMNFA